MGAARWFLTMLTCFGCDQELSQQDGKARNRPVPLKPTGNKEETSAPVSWKKTDYKKVTKYTSQPHSHSAWLRVVNTVFGNVRSLRRIHLKFSIAPVTRPGLFVSSRCCPRGRPALSVQLLVLLFFLRQSERNPPSSIRETANIIKRQQEGA